MKSFVLLSLVLFVSVVTLHSQPNVPRYENPQIEFKYTVVIGSMQKIENAEKLQKLAIENGYECFIAPVNIRNKQHYRVCVGLIQDFTESKKQLSIIKKDLKIGNAWIWQAPQITEMAKSEQKKVEKPKQEVAKTEPVKTPEPQSKPVMKKIEPPEAPKPETSKPDTKSNIKEAQTSVPQNDIPTTVPTPPTKPVTPKVAEQPKTEPKTESPKVAEQPKTEPKTETPKVAEQPKTEPKTETPKVAEQPKTEPKTETPKVTEQPKTEPKTETPKVAEQPKTEPKTETPKTPEPPKKTTKKTNKQENEQNIAKQTPETTKETKSTEKETPKELTPPVFISDSMLVDLAKIFPQMITNIRNYEYAQANKYIHPDLHFYVIYNEESKPSVREFNSFEKFFAVFSAFTGKGTSFDFSNDIEQMLKKNPTIKPYPIYDCNGHKYNQKGLVVSTANANNINLLNSVRIYYRSFNQELLPEISDKVGKVESRIQASVIDTESSFIEGMYLGYIDGKWYLLVLDIKFRCR